MASWAGVPWAGTIANRLSKARYCHSGGNGRKLIHEAFADKIWRRAV